MPGKRRGLPPRSGLLVFSVLVLCLWWGGQCLHPQCARVGYSPRERPGGQARARHFPQLHGFSLDSSKRLFLPGWKWVSVLCSNLRAHSVLRRASTLSSRVSTCLWPRHPRWLVQCFVLITNVRPAHRRRELDVCSEVTTQLAPPVLLSLSAWLGACLGFTHFLGHLLGSAFPLSDDRFGGGG